MPRTIAIGDIHGCDMALEAILNAIAPAPEDFIITLGDVVDRGPNTRRTIDLLIELSQRCRYLGILGNHEEMMLRVVIDREPPHSWLRHGGVEALDSYGYCGNLDVIPEAHLNLLKNFHPYYEGEKHFFVHANYDPKKPLEQQNVEMLRWKKLDDYMPGPHFSGKAAVLGHTEDSTGEVFILKHLTCIDTCCYGGQWLTALDVTTGQLWQANQEGRLR